MRVLVKFKCDGYVGILVMPATRTILRAASIVLSYNAIISLDSLYIASLVLHITTMLALQFCTYFLVQESFDGQADGVWILLHGYCAASTGVELGTVEWTLEDMLCTVFCLYA